MVNDKNDDMHLILMCFAGIVILSRNDIL